MERYVGYPLRPAGMHPIGSYVLRGAGCHEGKDRGYMELRAILGCSTGSSPLCNSVWNLFMLFLVFGWTIMYEWGHPVAFLPSDGGDYTSLSQND
eukprot:6182318-Pleurochrysis_carterae.AAC.4